MKSLFASALALALIAGPVWAKPAKDDHPKAPGLSTRPCTRINPCATVTPPINSYTPFWTRDEAAKAGTPRQESGKT